MDVTLRSAIQPFVERSKPRQSKKFAPAVPSPMLQTPAMPRVLPPVAAGILKQARLQKKRKVELKPWKQTQAVKKVRAGHTQQQPASPAAVRRTK